LVSLRKRYRPESPDREAPPVSTPPSGHGTEPYPTQASADTTPTSQDAPAQEAAPKLEEGDAPQPSESGTGPAQEAAQSAIKQRLAETERAASMQREAIQQAPQYAESQSHEPPTVEQIIEATQLPDKAKRWLRAHPEYLTDIAKNNEIIALHNIARRQAGSEWDDRYFEKMEDLLGIRPAPQSDSGNGVEQPPSAPRNAIRQQYSGPPLSAPISREVPSFSSGRSQSHRAPLTKAEVEIARASGISDAQYQEGKERVERLKASGVIQ
jgi:hypothetical protein